MKDTREWLQKEFEHFEAEPPIDLWPEIEAQMKQEKAGKKKWIPYFSIAASILVLFGIFWSLRLFDREPSTMIAEDQPTEVLAPTNLELPNLEEETNIAEVSVLDEKEENKVLNPNQVEIETVPNKTKENRIERPAQLVANNPSRLDESKENISFEPAIEIEKPAHILSNINQSKNTVAIRTANSYEGHILNEVDMIPTRAPERIQRVGSINKLDLNDLTLEHAVAFATTGLNKIVNTPIEITQKDTGGETVKTYSFRLGNFSITKKQHVKTIKTDRS